MGGRGAKAIVFADTESGGIIHVANIKGGVGKSTVATNLASALSRKGPTLLVDLDVQGSATHALGKDPAKNHFSAWQLFSRRFCPEDRAGTAGHPWTAGIGEFFSELESRLLPQVVGRGSLHSIALQVHTCLDLIPAGAELFNPVGSRHLGNLRYNLDLCRTLYKYVVIDTPSVWNRLTRALYLHADLNLIPVTLNALSTKSLRDYLIRVKHLADRRDSVCIRIVKNEVFGKADSKIKGKTRTTSENRRFLDHLCEQVTRRTATGVASLPQTILLDLEIPESAVVRDAQDEGKTVREYSHYCAVTKAFDELAARVQDVLNTREYRRGNLRFVSGPFWTAGSILSYAAALALLLTNPEIGNPQAPRPVAPQQLTILPDSGPVTITFRDAAGLYRAAKFAICHYRAVVPSQAQINAYALETIEIHNRTRSSGQPLISGVGMVPAGTRLTFYPPEKISNPQEKHLIPVYRFFTSLVEDSFTYITGDWCERGTGGGTPHYGIDVAGALGAPVISPVDGVAYHHESPAAGRTLAVVNDGTAIFFSHLDKRFFRQGERVAQGDRIGTIGMTGRTSGPHVHIGYGIRSPKGDIVFGNSRYKVTDPKLFFYRQVFVDGVGRETPADQ